MSADQIRTWLADGVDFGSHTRTHPDLTKLTGEELKREIVGSAHDLEAIVDREVKSFAYPYGYISPSAESLVSDTYSIGFSTLEGINAVTENPAALRRTMVLPSSGAIDLALAVRRGVNYRQRFRIRAGRMRRRLWTKFSG
jgi:peptidoglycan/xylan/chitin deacetylase (PgdA/CDA1 family)